MNVLLLTAHSIAEYDDLRMFTRMGVPTFSIGAYTNPVAPGDDKRPALPEAPYYPELEAACHATRVRHAGEDASRVIDWAKGDLPDAVLQWADVIICHHFPEPWLFGNWRRIADHRVIWRTCGQSNPALELAMRRYVSDGLEIVRYSPREAAYFGSIGVFAGQTALIRFGKVLDDWGGWTGTDEVVGNLTQHMAQRGESTGFPYWQEATAGLPTRPAGPGSEVLPNGTGALDFDGMRQYLRDVRCYLYTGTNPASYTLGLMEALLTGTPTVVMGAQRFGTPGLWEADAIAGSQGFDWAAGARAQLELLLRDHRYAAALGAEQRARAQELFGLVGVAAEWADFLGVEVGA